MIKNISKLIDVKSIVTLVLTAVFSALSLNDKDRVTEYVGTSFTASVSIVPICL